MKGHEIAPNAMSHDTSLSFGARALYPVIRHAAFLAGRRDPSEAVPLPAIPALAQAFGASPSATKRYLDELRRAGWIETERPSRRASLRYIVHDSLEGKQARADRLRNRQPAGDSVVHEAGDSEARVGSQAGYSGGAHLPIGKTSDEDERPTVVLDETFDPVSGKRVGGRDLVWDAVVEATGASSRASAPVVRKAVASIREEAWEAAVAEGWTLARAQADPDAWERMLAAVVAQRAAEVVRLYPEAGPTAVARHWRRTDVIQAARRGQGWAGGTTPQDASDAARSALAALRGVA